MSERTLYINPLQIKYKTFGKKHERFNPRTVDNHGFSPESMRLLGRGIEKDGLNHCLLVTETSKNEYGLIAGERRLRAIWNLINRDQEAMKKGSERYLVKNPKNGKMEPAVDVYLTQGIECKISYEVNEKEHLRESITENTLHADLTDYEMLVQCEKMEAAGFTRKEQAETLGEISEAWISQSHSLLDGPNCILEAMRNGLLKRTAAITFLSVDPDGVEELLKDVIKQTFAEAKEKQLKARKELEEAVENQEESKRKLQLQSFCGNQESVKKANRQVARAGKAVDKAKKNLDKVVEKTDNPVVAVGGIIIKAKESGVSEKLRRPHPMKITRTMESEIAEKLKDGVKEVKTPKGKIISIRDARIVHETLKWQLNQSTAEHPLDVILAVK